MGAPQDWAPYSSVQDAARVYLRDPDLALDQIRSVVEPSAITSFVMSRGFTEESWGEALWQEVLVTDGHRLIIWRADDDMSNPGDDGEPHRILMASVRSILLSTITDQVLSTEYDVLSDGTRRLAEVKLRKTDIYCESFRFVKSVDNGGLAQMQRLLQFGRVLSRSL